MRNHLGAVVLLAILALALIWALAAWAGTSDYHPRGKDYSFDKLSEK